MRRFGITTTGCLAVIVWVAALLVSILITIIFKVIGLMMVLFALIWGAVFYMFRRR